MINRLSAVLLAAMLPLATPSFAAPGSVLLQDVRIIDGNGGPPQEHADILIKGSKIAAITDHTAQVPAQQKHPKPAPPKAAAHDSTGNGPGAPDSSASDVVKADPAAADASPDTPPAPLHGPRIINLAGKTVLPGLISDHSHLGLVNGTTASGKNVTQANIIRQLKQYAAYGVTSVTSLGLNLKPFYQLRPLAHRGKIQVADMFGADRGFGSPDSAPPAAMGILDTQVYRPATPDEARSEVRETALRHPDLVKIWVDDMHHTFAKKMNPEVYKAIIDEAHANGLRVAAHVYYLEDAKQLVSDGVDILAHGVRDQPVDPDFIQSMKNHGSWYVPTLELDESFYVYAESPQWTQDAFFRRSLQPALAKQLDDAAWRQKILADSKTLAVEKEALATNMKNIKTLFDAGVKIGFGTDSGATPLRIAGFAEHRELKLLTEAGLTPLQAIQTATKNAAALLHRDDRGVIAVGKLADLLIVDGDPSRNIGDLDNIEGVWRRGKQIAGPINKKHP
jgi:imidazolonepropionase-like amidohydrolase